MHHVAPLRSLTALALLALLASPWSALADEAQDAFFAGLDLVEDGDCAGAIPAFEQSLALNPELHQARLYLADCLHAGGQDEAARTQLEVYLTADFPGAETDRAKELYTACGGDLDELFPPEVLPDPDPPPVTDPWTPLTVEIGVALEHHANRVALTEAGPQIGARIVPWRWIEISVRGGVGFAAYPDHEGTVSVPSFAVGAHFSAPVGPVRIVAGVEVPLLVSRYTDAARLDAGVLGEAGVRVAVPGSRLVVGGRVHGGFAVAPWVGGGVQVGVQIGPLGDTP